MKRVLIAEDNDSNYLLMTYVLKNRYEFDRARNGQEAVDMVESYAPDLIIMDLKMPVINGIEVSRRIRKNHPDIWMTTAGERGLILLTSGMISTATVTSVTTAITGMSLTFATTAITAITLTTGI